MVVRREQRGGEVEQGARARALLAHAAQHGYTLVELMAVVSIIGILAAVAIYGTRKYIRASKTAEATSMIANIRAAEETYRDETFKYLGLTNFNSWHPVNVPLANVYSWDTDNGQISTIFHTLGVQPTGPVRYTYTVFAGDVGSTTPEFPTAAKLASFNFPAITGPYYVIIAKADFTRRSLSDGERPLYALAHSYSSAVHIEE
jgi:type IV pilus assembly protein PilA